MSGPDLWDPEDESDVPLQAVANAGAELDAGRAVGLVLAFEGIERGAGIRPAFAEAPGRVEAGPDFEAVNRVWRAAPA